MDEFDVNLADGQLRVCRWPGGGPVVIAVHGITANAYAWGAVAAALDGGVTLVAPDLRGRAGSAALPGPYGLDRHVDDLVALMDALDVPRAVVAGHSMGAFVAALLAVRHPERVESLVLVDGGVTLAVPDEADIDAILAAVIGPAMKRLSMTFESREAHLDFWRAHPALRDAWSPDVTGYLDRDLVGTAPELRSSCVLDAIRADGADTLIGADVTTAARRLTVPATMLWAARGMLDEPTGLYTAVRLAGLPMAVAPAVDANHYTILLAPDAAGRVAAAIREAAMVGRQH